MALPLVNAPRYSTKLPSTGQDVNYRPYTVKEEKVLMIALESKDQKQILGAVKDVISGCVQDIDVQELTTFDLEWMFLQLRSKAVGEKIDLKMKCQQDGCDGQTDITVDVEDIGIEGDPQQKTIPITDTVGVTVRYPTIKLVENYDQEKLKSVEGAFDMIIGCIDSIYDADNVYDCKNENPEDVKGFVDNLTSDQFKQIGEFFESVPQVKHNLTWKCSKCGEQNEMVLEGLESFFT